VDGIVADANRTGGDDISAPHHRTLRIYDEDDSMLTRLLFTFAALSLLEVPAIAQDIPAKLAPPREEPLVGKYVAKGVQIYVCYRQ